MPMCRKCSVPAQTRRCPECATIVDVSCPRCQMHAQVTAGFRCGSCGRAPICMGHFSREDKLCADCSLRRQPPSRSDLKPLKKNEFGHREYTWQRDGSRLVLIPAGEFLYGDDNQLSYLPSFLIDVWPVTNDQYHRFVTATRHRQPNEWDDPDMRQPRRPVTGVTWDDASAYATWAGKQLPKEQEWEKAARGIDGRMYPWGNAPPHSKQANFAHQIGRPSSVGRFPDGRSPYGCVEMSGNVMEWCSSWFDQSRGTRVLRGGAWVSQPNTLRAAFRFGDQPELDYPIVGFRCSLPLR